MYYFIKRKKKNLFFRNGLRKKNSWTLSAYAIGLSLRKLIITLKEDFTTEGKY